MSVAAKCCGLWLVYAIAVVLCGGRCYQPLICYCVCGKQHLSFFLVFYFLIFKAPQAAALRLGCLVFFQGVVAVTSSSAVVVAELELFLVRSRLQYC